MISCGYFPNLYDDELLYSGFARHLHRLGIKGSQANNYALYGTRSKTIVFYALDLDTFINSLPQYYTLSADEIIDNHTLYPWHAPFLPKDRQIVVRQGMRGRGGQSLYSSIGIRNQKVKLPQYLRYCPLCVKTDRVEHRETYWHRVHQIPGILVCPSHHIGLIDSIVKIKSCSAFNAYVPAEEVCPKIREDETFSIIGGIPLLYAEGCAWLLNRSSQESDSRALIRRFMEILRISGYVPENRKFGWPTLLEKLIQFNIEPVQQDLGPIVFSIDYRSLASIFTPRSRSLPPYSIIMLCNFLGISIKDLINTPEIRVDPERAFYPCPNKICPEYMNRPITSYEIRFSQGARGKVGIFKCQACGCAFQKTLGKDHPRSIRMIDHGELWTDTLRKLWIQNDVTLKDISQALNTHATTIRKTAIRLGLPGREPHPYKTKVAQLPALTPSSLYDRKQVSHREKFLKIVADNPGISRSQIEAVASGTYNWLLENDFEWLAAHNVPCIPSSNPGKNKRYWENREQKLIDQLPEKVAIIREKPGKPIRVTKSAVEREYVHTSFTPTSLKKMPDFSRLLSDSIESRFDFGLRMIDWAYQELIRCSGYVQRRELLKMAGVRKLIGNPVIQGKIDGYLS